MSNQADFCDASQRRERNDEKSLKEKDSENNLDVVARLIKIIISAF